MEELKQQCGYHNLTMCDNCTNIYECDEETKKETVAKAIFYKKRCENYNTHYYCCFCGAKLKEE